MWMGVVRPCPPIRKDIVTPGYLLIMQHCFQTLMNAKVILAKTTGHALMDLHQFFAIALKDGQDRCVKQVNTRM